MSFRFFTTWAKEWDVENDADRGDAEEDSKKNAGDDTVKKIGRKVQQEGNLRGKLFFTNYIKKPFEI